MKTYCQKLACGLVLILAAASIAAANPVEDSFKAEVIRVDDGEVAIKGWVDAKKSVFCITIQLKEPGETVTLHSLKLVRPDGRKLAPDAWEDQTPRASASVPSLEFRRGRARGRRAVVSPGVSAPRHIVREDQVSEESRPRISFGFGISSDGGDGHGLHEGGFGAARHPVVVRPGLSIPLQRRGSTGDTTGSTTSVTACWKTAALKATDLSQCELEVKLLRTQRDKRSLTTLVLAMGYREDEKADPPPDEDDEDQQTAKDLIREIDFTQKSVVKTKVFN